MSAPEPNKEQPIIYLDDPDAVSEQGFFDDEKSEEKPPAQPLENANIFQAIYRFYGNYWESKGRASASEFWGALTYLVLGSLLFFGSTAWMGSIVALDSTSSLLRTIYLLVAILDPLWIIINLGPTISLFKRRRNARRASRRSQ